MTTTTENLDALFDAPSALDLARSDRTMLERMLCTELVSQHGTATVDAALAVVADDDVRSGACRTIVGLVRSMREDRLTVDFATVMDALRAKDLLAREFGSAAGVLDVCQVALRAWDVTALARLVAAEGAKDRLEAATRAASVAAGRGDLDAARAALAEVERQSTGLDYGIDRVADVDVNDEESPGVAVGWRGLDRLYRVEPGLLTVVTGWPGSSKSTVLDNIAVQLAATQGWRFAMFSAETAPTARHVRHLVQIYANRAWSALTVDQRERWKSWVGEHFAWVRSTDGVTVDEILRRADVIRRTTPVDGLIIDPWNEVDHIRPRELTETEYISACLTRVRQWARRRCVHVWIVAHPTKPERGNMDRPPSLSDIAGSAHWRNKADMGLIIHRDQLGGGPTEISVTKVRFAAHGAVGKVRMSWNGASGAYLEDQHRKQAI